MGEVVIKPGECYRLVNGQVIRVVSVVGSHIRYDIYDHVAQKWFEYPSVVPCSAAKEPADDPSKCLVPKRQQ
jgi:hypothetical protein